MKVPLSNLNWPIDSLDYFLNNFPRSIMLGELTGEYLAFTSSLEKWVYFKKNNIYGIQKDALIPNGTIFRNYPNIPASR